MAGDLYSTIPSDWVGDEIDDFRLALKREGKSDKTVDSYCSDAALFLNWCVNGDRLGDTSVEKLAPDYLNKNRDNGYSNASICRHRSSLRAYFRLCREGSDPLATYKPPPPAPGEPHPLPGLMDDVRKMLAVSKGAHKVAIALQGFAGLRIDEVRSVTLGSLDIDFTNLQVRGKGNKIRNVPIAPELKVILTDWVGDWTVFPTDRPLVPMTDRGIRAAITRAGERAEIARPVSSHDLRMTFGTVVYDKTKDLRTTQELLGHASPNTTVRYTGISEEAKREAVKAAMT